MGGWRSIREAEHVHQAEESRQLLSPSRAGHALLALRRFDRFRPVLSRVLDRRELPHLPAQAGRLLRARMTEPRVLAAQPLHCASAPTAPTPGRPPKPGPDPPLHRSPAPAHARIAPSFGPRRKTAHRAFLLDRDLPEQQLSAHVAQGSRARSISQREGSAYTSGPVRAAPSPAIPHLREAPNLPFGSRPPLPEDPSQTLPPDRARDRSLPPTHLCSGCGPPQPAELREPSHPELRIPPGVVQSPSPLNQHTPRLARTAIRGSRYLSSLALSRG